MKRRAQWVLQLQWVLRWGLRWIASKPCWVLAIWLLLALLALPGLFRLRLDNSAERFFVDDAEALARYHHAQELLRSRAQGLRVVAFGDGLWTEEGLSWLARFETQAPRIRGVAGAAGLYGHHRLDAAGRVAPWPPPDPAAFRRQVLADPLDLHAGWVTPGGDAVSLLVAVDDPAQPFLDGEGPDRLHEAVAALRRLADTAPPGVEVAMAGLPLVQIALDAEMVRMMRTFFPALAAIAALGLFAGFRRAGDALAGLAFVAVCLVVTLGVAGWAGLRIDLVTVVLLPLLFVIALATAVHVLRTFRLQARADSVTDSITDSAVDAAIDAATDSAVATYRVKAWPVFFTGLTTAIGFGSLTLADVPPIRSLGAWSAFGLALLTLGAFTLLPALLASLARRTPADVDDRPGGPRRRSAGWGGRLAAGSIRHRRVVFGLFGLGALLAVAGLPRLHVDTRVVSYFEPDHPLRRELATVESFGFGSAQIDLWIECRASSCEAFDSPARLEALGELARALRAEPGVQGAMGPHDVRHWIVDAEARTWFRWQAILQTLPPPGRAARMALFVRSAASESSRSLESVAARAESLARQAFPRAHVWTTGADPLVRAAQRSLLRTMWLSLGLTALAIAVVLVLVLDRLAHGTAALGASAWPVLAVLGAMGWAGVPVEATTVMIAAVVLGLAVDDTLHVFGELRCSREDAHAPRDAETRIIRAFDRVAPSLALSTTVLAAGFLACAGSDLVPVARFGVLSALALVLALAADLLLVPAVLAGRTSGHASDQQNHRRDGEQ